MCTAGKALNTEFSRCMSRMSYAFLQSMVPEKKSCNISLAFLLWFSIKRRLTASKRVLKTGRYDSVRLTGEALTDHLTCSSLPI